MTSAKNSIFDQVTNGNGYIWYVDQTSGHDGDIYFKKNKIFPEDYWQSIRIETDHIPSMSKNPPENSNLSTPKRSKIEKIALPILYLGLLFFIINRL